jgi:hypothetical protein
MGRRLVGEEALQDIPASCGDPTSGLVSEEEASVTAAVSQALALELARLDPEDRRLLTSSFLDGLSTADIRPGDASGFEEAVSPVRAGSFRAAHGSKERGVGRSEMTSLLNRGDLDFASW